MRSIPRWWFIKVYDFITTIGIHSTDPVPESLSSSRLALMMRLAYCRRPQTWPFGGTNLVSQLGQTKSSEGNIPQASSWVCDATSLLVETWFCEASWNICKYKIHFEVSNIFYLQELGYSFTTIIIFRRILQGERKCDNSASTNVCNVSKKQI